MIEANALAPSFSLEGLDENGTTQTYTLESLLEGKPFLVLYFYPRDNTPGCTTEACDFRDNFNRWSALAQVVGVSPDSVESHGKFREKQGLNFPLLCDPEHTMMTEYNAWGEKKLYGKVSIGTIRSTVIVNSDGTVLKHWKRVQVKGHVDKVIEAMEKAQA